MKLPERWQNVIEENDRHFLIEKKLVLIYTIANPIYM